MIAAYNTSWAGQGWGTKEPLVV